MAPEKIAIRRATISDEASVMVAMTYSKGLPRHFTDNSIKSRFYEELFFAKHSKTPQKFQKIPPIILLIVSFYTLVPGRNVIYRP